jgi:hypothetical protein
MLKAYSEASLFPSFSVVEYSEHVVEYGEHVVEYGEHVAEYAYCDQFSGDYGGY